MGKFRIGVGRIWYEANGFSCLEADRNHFESLGGILVGPEMFEQNERHDEVTGFVNRLMAEGRDIEIVPLLSAGVLPGGNVSVDVVAYLEQTLRRILREAGELNGINLALHGAMSSDAIPDLEGHFLKIVHEERGHEIPVVCSLDCHAVVTRQMMTFATALVAYRTHPHIDVVETGERAASILLRTLRKEIKPVMVAQKIPMIVPPPDDGTNADPLKKLFDEFSGWDKVNGVLACSLCCSQCWLDVPEQGWTALAVTNNDPGLAKQLAEKLALDVWEERESLMPEPMQSPESAVYAATSASGVPVIITDSADTVGAGAPGDTTTLLKVLWEHRHEVDGMILIHLPDPEAIKTIQAAGVSATVTLQVGGRRDRRFSEPLKLTGCVACLTDGIISDDGKFGSEPFVDVGKLACLSIDNLRVVLSERIVMGPQPSLFRKVGLEPFKAKIVALKTGVGFKKTYGHIAKAVFRSDCPGSASYNLANYNYIRAPRPLYPLERAMSWRPGK